MNAKPNLNGNSPESFLDAGSKLHLVATTAQISMREALCEITHGRNYQLSEDAQSDRKEDLDRIAKITAALDDLEAMAQEIYDAGLAL
jgi:hypothetical protein